MYIPDDFEEIIGRTLLDSVHNKKMQNGIGKLDWSNVRSAVIYGLLSGLLAIILYVVSVGDVFAINSHALVNAGIFGLLGSLVSVVKNLLTTNSGNFAGLVSVIPDKTL